MNYLIPVVFFCIFDTHQVCDGHTAIYKHEISPVTVDKDGLTTVINTPMGCLMAGYQDVAREMDEIKKANPDKDLEFRVVCKRTDQRL